MPLTRADRELRRRGVGGSEIASVVGQHPYRGPLSVWATKARGPEGAVAPLVDEAEAEEDPRAELGHFIEPALRALYTHRTGVEVAPASTLAHPETPWAMATPDGLGVTELRGLEIKAVGARMLHHWAEDSMPDYVRLQAAWGMAVTGRPAWDVCALLGGTTFSIWTVRRDIELEDMLLEAGAQFWTVYVLGDVPPPPRDPEEARAFLLARYPGSERTKCRDVAGDTEIADLVETLAEAKGDLDRAKAEVDDITTRLCGTVGDDYGIQGPWGRFTWAPRVGSPRWKEIAEALAGGAVRADLIDQHRGASSRTPRLTMKETRR